MPPGAANSTPGRYLPLEDTNRIYATAKITDHSTGIVCGFRGAAQIAYNWWAMLLSGVLWVLEGFAAFFLPEATLYAVVFAFGPFALVDGIADPDTGLLA